MNSEFPQLLKNIQEATRKGNYALRSHTRTIWKNMKEKNICKACRQGKLYKREVNQKYECEGLEVRIDGIPALVRKKCAQIYFPPGIGDKITAAANQLFLLSEIKHTGKYIAAV